jgi:REP-associated tyrosine transposase
MSRFARIVVPDCWHHVTQRGNYRQTVFFNDAERRMYLQLLRYHCGRHDVRIAGYCLMGNHVHMIAIPPGEKSLAHALGRTHTEYSRWINTERCRMGHLWQSRFYSCVLDDHHQWEALRYVELNPIRAGLVNDPAGWRWSSASAHLTGWDAAGLIDWADWRGRWTQETWREALHRGIGEGDLLERIRTSTRTGRPAAGEDFMIRAEVILGRRLRPEKRGPKPKA